MWDALGRVRQVIDAGGQATSYDYDADGRLVRITPPAGGATVLTYDVRGFRTGVSGPDGSWTFVPDNHGNPVEIVNPRGGRTVQQFDALDRVVFSQGPDVVRQVVHDGYGEEGFFASVTEGGRTRKFVQDGRGRTVAVVEPDGATRTEIFYNEQDEEIALQVRYGGALQTCTVLVKDEKGRVIVRRVQDGAFGGTATRALEWKTFYTAAGRVEREVDPEDRGRLYGWDGQGRLAQIRNGAGQVLREFRYGEDDRVSEVLWPDPATGTGELVRLEKRTWTARKELRRVEDRLGFGTTYQYGPLPGQVTSVTDALGCRTVTEYDVQEVEQVLALADVRTPLGLRDRAILELCWSCGPRRMELVAIRLYDLDRDRGTLMIREGKGRTLRVIPVGERALRWIDKYLREVRPELVVPPDEGVVFLTHHAKGFEIGSITELVREYVRRAELGKEGAVHLLRHSCATALLEGGADVRYVQALLGHAKLETTQIYTHVSIKKLKEVHDACHPARLAPSKRPKLPTPKSDLPNS